MIVAQSVVVVEIEGREDLQLREGACLQRELFYSSCYERVAGLDLTHNVREPSFEHLVRINNHGGHQVQHDFTDNICIWLETQAEKCSLYLEGSGG